MEKNLHIVSFDYPYPPNYGGIIDVFYKIKALSKQGVKVHLHYFSNMQKDYEELNSICYKTFFYKKKTFNLDYLFNKLPIRVLYRVDQELIKNLSKDNYPILYESINTTYFSKHPFLVNRKQFLRPHNIEVEYMNYLSRNELNIFYKLAYKLESLKLRNIESDFSQFEALFPINKSDSLFFKKRHPNVITVNAFHQDIKNVRFDSTGDYILFHGNLNIIENKQTALWINNKIAKELPNLTFIIAGKSIDNFSFERKINQKNVILKKNLSKEDMNRLVGKAHIILLKTSIPSGTKLKLIHSLYSKSHIISDVNTVKNKDKFKDLIYIRETTNEVIELIKILMNEKLSQEKINKRNLFLSREFNNSLLSDKMVNVIF